MKEIDKLIAYLRNIYKSLPVLPKGITGFIVAITPWIALIFGVFGVLGMLVAIGIFTFLSPLVLTGGGVAVTTGISVNLIIGLASSILMLLAVPALFAKKASGWRLIFIAQLLGVISAIVSLALLDVIFPLIGLYILFQIEPDYKK
ncbi:MAG: hypothetical protein Q7K11_01185 [Candidatus Berkelbacteria bacterium]|nr:hypothetical protein [Candidatus Berkelbacteria bacterium]